MSKFRFSHVEFDADKYRFYCPGCQCSHFVLIALDGWEWNGDEERPTILPSVHSVGVEPCTPEELDRLMAGEVVKPRDITCHLWIKNGKIEYQPDSTHALSGQTVDMEDVDVP